MQTIYHHTDANPAYGKPHFADRLTRVDIRFSSDQVFVTHFCDVNRGYIDTQYLTNIYDKSEFNWTMMLNWLHAHGYIVHEWNTGQQHGARAWRGVEPWAIRKADQIKELRLKMKERGEALQREFIDLAFDYI